MAQSLIPGRFRFPLLAPIGAAGFVAALACGSSARSGDDTGFGADGGGGGGGTPTNDQDAGPGFVGAGSDAGGGGGGTQTGGCSPNPLNYEVPGNGCDDDGDGTVDNVPQCDKGLAVDGDAEAFAKAIGLCQKADAKHWGLVSAKYTSGASSDAPNDGQHGILPKFGNSLTPREGSSLGVLSTGYAREYDSSSGRGSGNPKDGASSGLFGIGAKFHQVDPFTGSPGDPPGSLPSGFPASSGSCKPDSTVYNVASVSLQIKAPANAKGVAVDFDFHTSEWPAFICSKYNDGFITYLKSSAFQGGQPGNISFDMNKSPISVNNAFFDRCTPKGWVNCPPKIDFSTGNVVYGPGKMQMDCGAGEGELQGTGFGGKYQQCTKSPQESLGGATGWLTSQAPVAPGETITVDFIIWNTGDENLDSSVLVDKLTWAPGAVVTQTVRPH